MMNQVTPPLMRKPAEGRIQDLPPVETTMYPSRFRHAICNNKMLESGSRYYCPSCGLWWRK